MSDDSLSSEYQTTRSISCFKRLTVAVAVSPPGRWLVKNIVNRIDIWLIHLSKGRLSLTKLLGFPLLILTTRGARSGKVRETPLIFLRDGEKVIVIASSLGSPKHPQWYFNLLANRTASLSFAGITGAYSFVVVEGKERQIYWERMLAVYSGYDRYAELADGRRIPVVVFSPLD